MVSTALRGRACGTSGVEGESRLTQGRPEVVRSLRLMSAAGPVKGSGAEGAGPGRKVYASPPGGLRTLVGPGRCPAVVAVCLSPHPVSRTYSTGAGKPPWCRPSVRQLMCGRAPRAGGCDKSLSTPVLRGTRALQRIPPNFYTWWVPEKFLIRDDDL